MSLYFDASVLVSFLTLDPLSGRAVAALQNDTATFTVSDWAGAEFASAVARRFRMGTITETEARRAFAGFDEWVARAANLVATTATDMELAASFVCRLELGLRAPDALHIALAHHHRCTLASFDVRMLEAAAKLGIKIWAEQPN